MSCMLGANYYRIGRNDTPEKWNMILRTIHGLPWARLSFLGYYLDGQLNVLFNISNCDFPRFQEALREVHGESRSHANKWLDRRVSVSRCMAVRLNWSHSHIPCAFECLHIFILNSTATSRKASSLLVICQGRHPWWENKEFWAHESNVKFCDWLWCGDMRWLNHHQSEWHRICREPSLEIL